MPNETPVMFWLVLVMLFARYLLENNIIANETFLGNYAIPGSCSVIFVEDRAWVEGVVKGKVTVAPRAPESSTGTFLYSFFTKASALAALPPGCFSAYAQAAR